MSTAYKALLKRPRWRRTHAVKNPPRIMLFAQEKHVTVLWGGTP